MFKSRTPELHKRAVIILRRSLKISLECQANSCWSSRQKKHAVLRSHFTLCLHIHCQSKYISSGKNHDTKNTKEPADWESLNRSRGRLFLLAGSKKSIHNFCE